MCRKRRKAETQSSTLSQGRADARSPQHTSNTSAMHTKARVHRRQRHAFLRRILHCLKEKGVECRHELSLAQGRCISYTHRAQLRLQFLVFLSAFIFAVVITCAHSSAMLVVQEKCNFCRGCFATFIFVFKLDCSFPHSKTPL